jgi:hypothetical protein
LWQNRGTAGMEWIPFLPQKIKAVFKDILQSKVCGRIMAHNFSGVT